MRFAPFQSHRVISRNHEAVAIAISATLIEFASKVSEKEGRSGMGRKKELLKCFSDWAGFYGRYKLKEGGAWKARALMIYSSEEGERGLPLM